MPNFTFCRRGREHETITFLFFSWTLIQSFRIQLQKNCQRLTNYTKWNKRHKLWSSTNSLFKWLFKWRCCLRFRLCCREGGERKNQTAGGRGAMERGKRAFFALSTERLICFKSSGRPSAEERAWPWNMYIAGCSRYLLGFLWPHINYLKCRTLLWRLCIALALLSSRKSLRDYSKSTYQRTNVHSRDSLELRSIEKSGFRFWNPDFGFYNRTRVPLPIPRGRYPINHRCNIYRYKSL